MVMPEQANRTLGTRFAPPSWLTSDAFLLMIASIPGVMLRLIWAIRQIGHPGLNLGEAHNEAVGLALNGFLSSVYRPPNTIYPPDGLPTAHLLPIPMSIAAGIYRMFGIDTPLATVVLTVLAVTVTYIGYVLFFYAFAGLGLSRLARLAAFFALSLIPLNIHLETEDFRFWEGGYAVALAAALLLVLARLDRRASIGWAPFAGLAFLNALLFFISPQLGLAGYLCVALLMWRTLPFRRWMGAGLVLALALAVFIVPWTIRNERLLGKPILLRSNLGLELALAFHEGALDGDEKAAFERRYSSIHPNVTDGAYARMKAAGGEEPYAEELGAETKAWMREHPLDVVRLGLRHLGQFLFPPPWVSSIFVDAPLQARDVFWTAMTWSYSLLGLLGCAFAVLRGDRRFRYAAILLVVSTLPYALVQPITRYHYVVYALTVFFTFVLLDRGALLLAPLRRLRARLG